MNPHRSSELARVVLAVPMLPPRVLGPASAPADFLEGDACVFDAPGGPHRFESVRVEAGRIDATSLDGSMGDDLWVASDEARVHFRVRPAWGNVPPGTPGVVRVTFRGAEPNREIVVTAAFTTGEGRTLVLPSGAATSVESFYTGPSGPLHEVRVDAHPFAHLGLRHAELELETTGPATVVSVWRPLRFDAWLDDAVRGRVLAAPVVEVAAGRARVSHWSRGERWAQLVYDPRDDAHRMRAGRHALRVSWSTGHRVDATLVVRDDGAIALER